MKDQCNTGVFLRLGGGGGGGGDMQYRSLSQAEGNRAMSSFKTLIKGG